MPCIFLGCPTFGGGGQSSFSVVMYGHPDGEEQAFLASPPPRRAAGFQAVKGFSKIKGKGALLSFNRQRQW